MAQPASVTPIRRALLSVFDKTGIVDLARSLADDGVELISTGSTAATIRAHGIPVTDVSALTGFPECLDGRVKTLHPRIHAGILADRTLESHRAQLADLDIEGIDLVVVNLYPFAATVASGASFADCIEKIDIGGPTMIRAAAKNHASVAVVVDPADYTRIAERVHEAGGLDDDERLALAGAAFAHTATYDAAVSSWFAGLNGEAIPPFVAQTFERAATLRYGENSHQNAGLYVGAGTRAGGHGEGLAHAEQLGGKEMSFNNYQDADAAWRAVWDHERPCVAVIKHANPCGIAVGETIAEAHLRAHACDPLSAFGSVVAANRTVDAEMARNLAPIFTEVVLAPDFTPEALEVFSAKKNLRVLRVAGGERLREPRLEMRAIDGGLLVQEADRLQSEGDTPANWRLVSGDAADPATLADLEFAWRAIRAVKSNAILLAHDGATVGVGMGQVNRVDSCHLAVTRANTLGDGQERARGAVAASDAFFPFADGLEVLIDAGVRAVVQPGGSIRDEEVIAAAQAAGITMYLTGTRHFMH